MRLNALNLVFINIKSYFDKHLFRLGHTNPTSSPSLSLPFSALENMNDFEGSFMNLLYACEKKQKKRDLATQDTKWEEGPGRFSLSAKD